MKASDFLTELRRNPEKNVDKPMVEELLSIRDKYPDDELYVSFTDVNKLGINPRPVDATTPLGIYAYPLDYVIQRNMNVPYGQDKPYLQVFKSKPGTRVLNLGVNDKQFADSLREATFSILNRYGIDELNLENARKNRVFSYSQISNIMSVLGLNSTDKDSLLFSKILRKAGIDQVLDIDGGEIHSGEPTQTVFVNPRMIEHITAIKNRTKRDINIKHGLYSMHNKPRNEYGYGALKYHVKRLKQLAISGTRRRDIEKWMKLNYPKMLDEEFELPDFIMALRNYVKETGAVLPEVAIEVVKRAKRFTDRTAKEITEVISRNSGNIDRNHIRHLVHSYDDYMEMIHPIVRNVKTASDIFIDIVDSFEAFVNPLLK